MVWDCSLTFVDKDEDLGEEESRKVPRVEVEEHLQGRGRELRVGGVKESCTDAHILVFFQRTANNQMGQSCIVWMSNQNTPAHAHIVCEGYDSLSSCRNGNTRSLMCAVLLLLCCS